MIHPNRETRLIANNIGNCKRYIQANKYRIKKQRQRIKELKVLYADELKKISWNIRSKKYKYYKPIMDRESL